MIPALASALLPLLRHMDPERAHGIALRALRLGLAGTSRSPDDPALAIAVLGRTFSNPIGLAAGFDKGAVAAAALMRLGFGFVETGTVTPLPQAGNPRPRLFRLEPDRAVINRLGFNNAGLADYVRRLAALPGRPIPLGANVGINKEGADPVRDYPALIAAVAPHVDYAVINVSSPNTPGLRDLQSEDHLRAILTAVATVPRRPPILVKIAPDLADDAIAAVVESCVAHGVAGLIAGNTTITRPPGLRSPHAIEPGGLSGAPLFGLANRVLARAFLCARGRLTLIGAGGVFSGADVLTKIRAGASLVQLYTGFAWHGPAVIPRLKAELAIALKAAGFAHVRDAVGSAAQELAELEPMRFEPMRFLAGFAQIADRYDGFVLDLWGVIHDGVNAFPHAVDCLGHLRAAGKRTLLLSNAPRTNEAVREMMRRMGIEDALYTDILTSGEAVRRALQTPPDAWWAALGSRVYHLGPERDRPVLEGLPLTTVPTPAEADFVLNTGPDDHRNPSDMAEFEPILLDCARHRLPMICGNPDLEVIRGGVRVLCAGSLAARYQELGGDVRSLGKPDPAIYRPVLEQLGLPRDRVLAVGDSLRTDIAGAAGAGLDACWVLDGLHGEALRAADGGYDPAAVERAARAAGLAPVAAMARFAW